MDLPISEWTRENCPAYYITARREEVKLILAHIVAVNKNLTVNTMVFTDDVYIRIAPQHLLNSYNFKYNVLSYGPDTFRELHMRELTLTTGKRFIEKYINGTPPTPNPFTFPYF